MEIYGDSSSATATGIKLDQTSMIINIGDEKKQLNALSHLLTAKTRLHGNQVMKKLQLSILKDRLRQ